MKHLAEENRLLLTLNLTKLQCLLHCRWPHFTRFKDFAVYLIIVNISPRVFANNYSVLVALIFVYV